MSSLTFRESRLQANEVTQPNGIGLAGGSMHPFAVLDGIPPLKMLMRLAPEVELSLGLLYFGDT